METATKVTRQEGLKKGYLQNKKQILKPVIRSYPMIGDNPKHVLYFMQDGATKFYVLPKNGYNEFAKIFKDEEEMRWFSDIIGRNLNPNTREDNFWETFTVKVTKDVKLMTVGVEFDLSDPMDNLRSRILKLYDEFTEGWENRYNKPKSKFVFVDEDYEEAFNNKEMTLMEEIFTYWGEIRSSSAKMKDFLITYNIVKKDTKQVPENASKEFLTNEIKKIFDTDREGAHKIIKDKDSDMKFFISRAVRCGAIERKGVTGFIIPGDDKQYNLLELIKHLNVLKEITDHTYLKIDTQIKQAKL